jgi:hypothetical protein
MKKWKEAVAESSELDSLAHELKEARARLAVYEKIKPTLSHNIPVYKSTGGQAAAVALISDVHVEERVDPADVPGTYNIYTPEICRKRMEQFAQRVVLMTNAQRSLTKITDLFLPILGDTITGHLHDDNKESNWLHPVQAIWTIKGILNDVIKHILDHGNFERIVVPMVTGNHGRLSVKPRAKTRNETNLEWLLYQMIAKDWEREPRLSFHIAGAAMMYVDIYGFPCRIMHGDLVKYNGGVGGLAVPLGQAIKDWDKIKPAAYTFMGHHHTCRDFGNVIVNGSVIGYNAYALNGHFAFEQPKQQYILMDQKRGKSLVSDIWCDYMPKRAES